MVEKISVLNGTGAPRLVGPGEVSGRPPGSENPEFLSSIATAIVTIPWIQPIPIVLELVLERHRMAFEVALHCSERRALLWWLAGQAFLELCGLIDRMVAVEGRPSNPTGIGQRGPTRSPRSRKISHGFSLPGGYGSAVNHPRKGLTIVRRFVGP